MLTNQCERARDSTNQSSPPGMQREVGYKRHCSFISPIPFNYAVQKRRRLVREHSEERNENTSMSSGVTDTNAISPRCNQGTFDGGATYRSRFVQSEQSSRHATREVSINNNNNIRYACTCLSPLRRSIPVLFRFAPAFGQPR